MKTIENQGNTKTKGNKGKQIKTNEKKRRKTNGNIGKLMKTHEDTRKQRKLKKTMENQ